MNNLESQLSGLEFFKGEKPENNNIILNSRVKLSRNLSGHKFLITSSSSEKDQIIKLVRGVIQGSVQLKDFRFFLIKDLSRLQRRLLAEEYIITNSIIEKPAHKAALVNNQPCHMGESLSVLVNEEDHLQIQCSVPGLNIIRVFKSANLLEKGLEEHINFTFEEDLGYLTASPIKLGTALKVSVLAHLPAIAISPEFQDFVKNLNQAGYAFSGYFDGNIEIVGNLFIISNCKTLGTSEEDIVEEMQAICLNIIENEREARSKLKKNDLIGFKDNVSRSYGLLKYAKILSYDEALELVSVIKLGIDEGLIKKLKDFDLFRVIKRISDAHMIMNSETDGDMTEDEIDMMRAKLLQKMIFKKD